MKITEPPATRGRPRNVAPDAALDAALQVFWKHGFEGTSLPDLTAATGMQRPSLYATFGNKESLYLRVLDHYVDRHMAFTRNALLLPTAHDVIAALLDGYARLVTTPGCPRGCFAVNGALACSDGASGVQEELVKRRRARLATLTKRFERAAAAGELQRGTAPAELARSIMALGQGMAVQAAAGASRAELLRLAAFTTRQLHGALREPASGARAKGTRARRAAPSRAATPREGIA
ncbi:TetR/AcrR family transcriptional regulator [Chiayiivirga flava]|uniref:AcrR family transcriptional regulator n=1 Tax=Chiayiivirga flava TaxID=659595 RepID=A0A7W8D9L1_9GAMM|nr:TetR/AcrR family transcriptional regulator [Chiayiivirga flava]MBB5209297.1 AcrR family transcriptional regulator [Chiayiivirga flava]